MAKYKYVGPSQIIQGEVVETVKWDGKADTANEFVGERYGTDWEYGGKKGLAIVVGGGWTADVGDYLVRYEDEPAWAMKASLFEASYAEVRPEPPKAATFYDRKDRPVEAMRWRGKEDSTDLRLFAGHWAGTVGHVTTVTTQAGSIALFGGDWVVKTADGHFRVLVDEEFHDEYSADRPISISEVVADLVNTVRAADAGLAYRVFRLGGVPTPEQAAELPEDLIVQADGSVSILGVINTLLARLGEPRVIIEVPTDMDRNPIPVVSGVYLSDEEFENGEE